MGPELTSSWRQGERKNTCVNTPFIHAYVHVQLHCICTCTLYLQLYFRVGAVCGDSRNFSLTLLHLFHYKTIGREGTEKHALRVLYT